MLAVLRKNMTIFSINIVRNKNDLMLASADILAYFFLIISFFGIQLPHLGCHSTLLHLRISFLLLWLQGSEMRSLNFSLHKLSN